MSENGVGDRCRLIISVIEGTEFLGIVGVKGMQLGLVGTVLSRSWTPVGAVKGAEFLG